MLAWYVAALCKYSRGDLIDLGSGNAPLAGIYLPLVDSVTWADWAETTHREVQLDCEVDLNKDFPFEDQSFDTIILSDVIEHIAEPNALFSEIYRILRPGGHIIIGVPFMYWIHEEPHDHFRYTRFALKRMGQKCGVQVIETSEVGGGLDVIQDVTCKLLAAKARPLAYAAYHFFRAVGALPGVKGLNKQAMQKMPLGYGAIFNKAAVDG